MGRFIDPIEPRKSFSHARIKPLVVEKVKRPAGLLCPSCGAKMKLDGSQSLQRRDRAVSDARGDGGCQTGSWPTCSARHSRSSPTQNRQPATMQTPQGFDATHGGELFPIERE